MTGRIALALACLMAAATARAQDDEPRDSERLTARGEAGVEYVGEPRAITNHAVHAGSLWTLLKSVWRWQAVAAVVNDEKQVLMMWRHRFITDSWAWELPMGLIEPGETPAEAAAAGTPV